MAQPYKAEKWTDIHDSAGWRELWAVIDAAGNPVAFGPRAAMEAYAAELQATGRTR